MSWGAGNISLNDDSGFPYYYSYYYDAVTAKATIITDPPMTTGKTYNFEVRSRITSSRDLGWLDGDGDGYESDHQSYIMSFRYAQDMVYGIIVADSTINAIPYYEPIEHCFLYSFD